MSAHGKKRGNGRAQLMLLRGGLDDFSGSGRGGAAALAADEADWQSFCARIGWQAHGSAMDCYADSDHEVGDDYADRLAEKIFGGAQLRDNVIELAVEREVKAAREQEAPVTPTALRRATARGALLALTVAGLVLIACILPFTVRNYRVYGDFLLLNSNAGYAMYSAQHPLHGTDFQAYAAAPLPDDLTPTPQNEAQWDRALMARGIQFVLAEPGRYLLLSLNHSLMNLVSLL